MDYIEEASPVKSFASSPVRPSPPYRSVRALQLYFSYRSGVMRNHRSRVYRVEGIVLSRRDWGEADRLVTLFTPDIGKLRVIAPGARKPLTRKSGHLELFTRGRFVLARGRSLDKITQAETRDYFPRLRDTLESVSAAYQLVELVDRFLEEHDENPLLYDLLLQALSWLEQGDNPELALRFFELRMLGYVGYQPQLFRCGICDQTLEPVEQFFSVSEGGVICPACAVGENALIPLSLTVLKVLRFMQSEEWSEARRLRLAEPLAAAVERVLHRYTAYQLERELKANRFVDQVRRLNEGKNR
jgi:DNA repair protein RecO (recombination protein O)